MQGTTPYTFKKTTLHPELKSFFKAMHQWIDSGCPQDNWWGFLKEYGLCANLGPSPLHYEHLVSLFGLNNLNRDFPFNPKGDYSCEQHYKNPMRLAFVEFYAED